MWPRPRGVTGHLSPAAVLARRDEVIHDLDDAVRLPWVTDRGIHLIRGPARLEGERRVRVGEALLTARRAVIVAVGSGAALPPVDGLAELAPWTNRQATTAEAVPQRLTVLGGGAVGCELAQAWASLGARVTLIEALPGLLPGEEPFAGEQLERSLAARGVDVRTGPQRDDRRRRPDARPRPRLAVRDRRRQRAGAAHPRRQVPGAGGRGQHHEPPRPGHPGRSVVPAGRVHRAPGGGGRPHPGARAPGRARRPVHALPAFPTRSEVWLRLLTSWTS